MEKGKFGLSLAAVAVIAFGFSALRQPQSVLLVTGFALLAEKNQWLNRQVLQALLLTIAYYIAALVTDWIFGGLARFFGWLDLYDAASAMSTVDSFVGDVLYIALIVLSVLAILRVLGGKDAGIPFISKVADGDIATVLKSKPQVAEVSVQTAPPVQDVPIQRQYQAPVQELAWSQTSPVATQEVTQDGPEPVPGLCPACSAPFHEDSLFCTECGTKIK